MGTLVWLREICDIKPMRPLSLLLWKHRGGAILTGELPDLLVVDEYQLLADEGRGPGYEVALAMLPTSVTLLLMSGSVANPQEVADWLSTHGRSVSVIFEIRRPVPLEEVFVEAILKNPFHGRKVRGNGPSS